MFLVDTHAHLYQDVFDADQDEMIKRALNAGVGLMLLPNINSSSILPMHELCGRYPSTIFPMMGLHPCDVGEDYAEVLSDMKIRFNHHEYIAVGETGIDLYWDKSTLPLQIESFRIQVQWAKELSLPLVIHARESFNELFDQLDELHDSTLRGIFHCFSGSIEQARKIMSYETFLMGIGGVITYEKSGLAEVVRHIPVEHLVLETDAPFLTPKPHRGKRNESSYLTFIASKLAESTGRSLQEIAQITTSNAIDLFNLSGKIQPV
jgi:TatD DNase family protein